MCCLVNVCVRRVDEAVATSIQELYQKGIAVRRLMRCLLYRPPQQRRVDGGAVATSVSGAVPEGAFGCGKGMIVVICHEERRYVPW